MSQSIHHPAISQWFASYADDLLGFFRYKIGEPDAPDLVQDVYLRALTYPAAGEVREPRAFLFRIAANLVVDHHRRSSFRHCESDEGLEETVGSSAPGPEQAASDSERVDRFYRALNELPAPCRHAFVLNRFDGLTHGEIAVRLGVSEKTVQRYVARAFEHCTERLDL